MLQIIWENLMDLCVLLTHSDIGKVRSEPNFQLWTCDQLALASGQVYYQQISESSFLFYFSKIRFYFFIIYKICF
jgi:hypothetical protein